MNIETPSRFQQAQTFNLFYDLAVTIYKEPRLIALAAHRLATGYAKRPDGTPDDRLFDALEAEGINYFSARVEIDHGYAEDNLFLQELKSIVKTIKNL